MRGRVWEGLLRSSVHPVMLEWSPGWSCLRGCPVFPQRLCTKAPGAHQPCQLCNSTVRPAGPALPRLMGTDWHWQLMPALALLLRADGGVSTCIHARNLPCPPLQAAVSRQGSCSPYTWVCDIPDIAVPCGEQTMGCSCPRLCC